MFSQKIMVTGGAGFIGSHLVEELIACGRTEVVVVVDNLTMSSLKNLAGLQDSRLKIIEFDVSNYDRMAFNLHKHSIETVCHLAVSPLVLSLKEPTIVMNNILGMQKALLECQRKGYFRKLLTFSTSEVYGSSDGMLLTEDDRLAPRTPYAAAKASCDLLTKSYGHSFGLDYTIIRPFNNYGPRKQVMDRAGIIPTAINRISRGEKITLFGHGNQVRDFVHVKDTVAAVIKILELPNATQHIVNVATGVGHTMKSVVEDIGSIMGVEPQIEYMPEREGDVSYLCGDGTKLEQLTGFTPLVTWEDGLRTCVDYYGKRL